MSADPATFVSVVAPMRNDADIIDAFLTDTLKVLRASFDRFELILVDDDSQDATRARVAAWLDANDSIRLMRLSRPFGTEIAISAGLETTIGDVVVVLMPETDPPELIPEFVARTEEGAGLVFGVRQSRAGQPWFLRLGARAFYWMGNKLLKLGIPPHSTHYRALQRPVVNSVLQIRDQLRYLRTLGAYVGYEGVVVPYEPIARRTPPRRKSLAEALSLAVGIIVSNSFVPLTAGAMLALLTALACFAYAVVAGTRLLLGEAGVARWEVVIALLAGVFALLLGIVAAYVARVLGESRGRPLYFVREERSGAAASALLHERNVVTDSIRS
ncbi:MAG: glycosyltransferase family 2 protein [Gemmatimonadaceae bacterium]